MKRVNSGYLSRSVWARLCPNNQRQNGRLGNHKRQNYCMSGKKNLELVKMSIRLLLMLRSPAKLPAPCPSSLNIFSITPSSAPVVSIPATAPQSFTTRPVCNARICTSLISNIRRPGELDESNFVAPYLQRRLIRDQFQQMEPELIGSALPIHLVSHVPDERIVRKKLYNKEHVHRKKSETFEKKVTRKCQKSFPLTKPPLVNTQLPTRALPATVALKTSTPSTSTISSVSLSISVTSATSLQAMQFPRAERRSSIRWMVIESGREFRRCCNSSVVIVGTSNPFLLPRNIKAMLPRITYRRCNGPLDEFHRPWRGLQEYADRILLETPSGNAQNRRPLGNMRWSTSQKLQPRCYFQKPPLRRLSIKRLTQRHGSKRRDFDSFFQLCAGQRSPSLFALMEFLSQDDLLRTDTHYENRNASEPFDSMTLLAGGKKCLRHLLPSTASNARSFAAGPSCKSELAPHRLFSQRQQPSRECKLLAYNDTILLLTTRSHTCRHSRLIETPVVQWYWMFCSKKMSKDRQTSTLFDNLFHFVSTGFSHIPAQLSRGNLRKLCNEY
eukprot:284816914_5